MDEPGPYTFRIFGRLCHLIGSLLPLPDALPAFAQIYVVGTGGEEEAAMRNIHHDNILDLELLTECADWLSRFNPYARFLKSAMNTLKEISASAVTFKSLTPEKKDAKRYNAPQPDDIAAVIEGDGQFGTKPREIIVRMHDNTLQRIDELHSGYFSMRYPIVWPNGEQGWDPDLFIKARVDPSASKFSVT